MWIFAKIDGCGIIRKVFLVVIKHDLIWETFWQIYLYRYNLFQDSLHYNVPLVNGVNIHNRFANYYSKCWLSVSTVIYLDILNYIHMR